MSIKKKLVTIRRIIFIGIFFIFVPLFIYFLFHKVQKVQAAAWYDNNWGYRKAITIDRTKVPNTDQTNFTILINRTDADLKTTGNGGHVGKANGGDIVFTQSDGTTLLTYEQEKYVATTGELIAWVKIPTLATASDTVIYIYYGYASAADQFDTAGNAWDSNFVSVWHLNEASGATAPDSKSTNNLTDTNSVTQATGIVGFDAQFNGTTGNKKLSITNASQTGLGITGNITFEAWIKSGTTTAATTGILSKTDASTNGYRMRTNSNTRVDCTVFNTSSGGAGSVLNIFADTTSWHHIACVYDGSYVRNYEDGVNNTSNTYSSGIATNALDFQLGTRGSQYFNGDIDEVRVSSTNRSADWIKTEYNNISSPSTFYSVASEESTPPAASGTYFMIFD